MLAVIDQAERLRQASPAWMNGRMREAGFRSGMTAAEGEEAGQRLVEMSKREYRMRESAAAPVREAGGGDPFLRPGFGAEGGYRGREDGVFDLEFDGVPVTGGPRELSYSELEREAELDATEQRLREAEAPSENLLDLSRDGVPMRAMRAMREATYGGDGTPEVFYEDDNTWRDVTDLYSVLDQERENGTPSLENGQVEGLAQAMQGGHPLSDVQIGVLRRLLEKYKTQIAALRASPDREGQDYLDVPDPATARVVKESAGPIDLSRDGVPVCEAAQTLDLMRPAKRRSSRFKVGKPSGEVTDAELEEDGVRLKAAA